MMLAGILFVILAVMIGRIILSSTGIAGFATLDSTNQNYTNNMSIHSAQELTSIRISGTLFGEGTANIYYKLNDTNTTTLLVGSIASDNGLPRTAKASYAAGEEVTIEHLPAIYTAYLDDGANNLQTAIPFTVPPSDMTLLIVANESDVLTTYRLPIIIGTTERTTTFTDLCVDTCTMPPATGYIIVEATGAAQITFSKIETGIKQNTAPILSLPLAPITIDAANMDNRIIDLSTHFTDADGDTLYYSVENSNIATTHVDNNIMTITPVQDGTQTLNIYASDLKDIATGTIEITVTGMTVANTTVNDTLPAINETTNTTVEINTTQENSTTNTTGIDINTTTNSTNETLPTVIANDTNSTVPTTLDCSNPDPNARPLECVIESTYFKPEAIYIENKDADRVAMLTPIGNLLIRGDVLQHSTGSPAVNDYQLGYRDTDSNYIPTVWIDSATGNLHLRGTLTEANGQLPYREGYTAYTNQRGIILALANLGEGDLILRGGLIPYRRVIE
jgi:hypothetical protein